MQSGPELKWKIEYHGIPRLLTGKPNYTLWYGGKEELEINLVVVEAAKGKLGESDLR